MTKPKRKVGRPTKEQELTTKKKRLKRDLEAELIRGNALVADNYYEYVKTLHNVAMGLDEDAGIVQKVSCTRALIELANNLEKRLLEQEAKENKVSEEVTPVEKEEAPQMAQLISLDVVENQ